MMFPPCRPAKPPWNVARASARPSRRGRPACCQICRQEPDCAACDRNVAWFAPASWNVRGDGSRTDGADGPPGCCWPAKFKLGRSRPPWPAVAGDGPPGCCLPATFKLGRSPPPWPRCEPSGRRIAVGLPRSSWDGHARPGQPNCGLLVPEFQSLAASARFAQWLTATDRRTDERTAAAFAGPCVGRPFAARTFAAPCAAQPSAEPCAARPSAAPCAGRTSAAAMRGAAIGAARGAPPPPGPEPPELGVGCGRRNPARED